MITKGYNTLALLSGKGGSGKTVLGLSMGRILAEANCRVLLLDCDVATHGATYFLESEVEVTQSNPESIKALSLVDILTSQEVIYEEMNSRIIRTRYGFDFIPSTNDPASDRGKQGLVNTRRSTDRLQNFVSYLNTEGKYDAIIFDCQAGYTLLTRTIVANTQRNLIVLEPDAVSSSSIRVLYIQIGKYLRKNNTWQIFNKLTEEERPVYEKVFGGTLFTNLPPIPFDWQVRAAFATCDIPNSSSMSSAFSLGVIRIMQTLFPNLSKKLKLREEATVGDWYRKINDSIKELSGKIQGLKIESIGQRKIWKQFRIRTIWYSATILGSFLFYFGLAYSLFPSSLGNFRSLFNGSALSVVSTTIGIMLVFGSYIYRRYSLIELNSEEQQVYAQASISEMQFELKKYVTLLATDPRLVEYEKHFSEQTKENFSDN